jgi:adenosylcobinamide kinase/adenosylcobinamide-phosphate guanylyltransferase
MPGPAKRPVILVTGGARSGKSTYAQRLAEGMGGNILFIATAEALDEEMALRVKSHRGSRPPGWVTREEPLSPARALEAVPPGTSGVVLDCLTLLCANILLEDPGAQWDSVEAEIIWELEAFLRKIRELGLGAIVVTNEVGMGIVPENSLARAFRDLAGRANQFMASQADYVYLMVAGIPVSVKSPEGRTP